LTTGSQATDRENKTSFPGESFASTQSGDASPQYKGFPSPAGN
jgi:hypothetical protein